MTSPSQEWGGGVGEESGHSWWQPQYHLLLTTTSCCFTCNSVSLSSVCTAPGSFSLSPRLTYRHNMYTYRTSSPHLTRWSSGVHKGDRWPRPPGSSVQCQDSTRLQHRYPQVSLRSRSSSPCPRQGSRCRSNCWDQSWRFDSPSKSLEPTRERPEIPQKIKTSISTTEKWPSASK